MSLDTVLLLLWKTSLSSDSISKRRQSYFKGARRLALVSTYLNRLHSIPSSLCVPEAPFPQCELEESPEENLVSVFNTTISVFS